MATPKTGRPRGRPSTPFEKDRDRFTVGRALAFREILGHELGIEETADRAWSVAAMLAVVGKRKIEFSGDHLSISVNRLLFPGAATSVRVLTRRLQRKWAVWQLAQEHRERVEAIKAIVLLQLLPYSGSEEDRHYEMFSIGYRSGEGAFALQEILLRMGYLDAELKTWQSALEEKLARIR